jgi:hypothetical protein
MSAPPISADVISLQLERNEFRKQGLLRQGAERRWWTMAHLAVAIAPVSSALGDGHQTDLHNATEHESARGNADDRQQSVQLTYAAIRKCLSNVRGVRRMLLRDRAFGIMIIPTLGTFCELLDKLQLRLKGGLTSVDADLDGIVMGAGDGNPSHSS